VTMIKRGDSPTAEQCSDKTVAARGSMVSIGQLAHHGEHYRVAVVKK
jgi:hypothetical protein